MKLVHLSDLHLGKRVNEFSMLEDQYYILSEILKIIDAEKPDAVLIAGDIYDKSIPPAEAVELFDGFLVKLSRRHQQVYIISGNHDSPERLSFANRLIDQSGIHISPVYHGEIEPYTLQDEYGEARLYMLPFIKPAHVRKYFPDEEISTYTDAMRTAISAMHTDSSVRNILMTHQFVTGAARSDSEEISVGGTDNIDASVFDDFDYVALGHIHGPQNIESPRIRYCGTPLKYSFSEAKHQKSVTIAELGTKGELSVRTVPLVPMHEMVELRGTYQELVTRSFYENTSYQTDYVHITLTDEESILDAMGKLRAVYHNLMKVDYDNARTRHNAVIEANEEIENKSPLELFSDFYELQNNAPMSDVQRDYVASLIELIKEGAQ